MKTLNKQEIKQISGSLCICSVATLPRVQGRERMIGTKGIVGRQIDMEACREWCCEKHNGIAWGVCKIEDDHFTGVLQTNLQKTVFQN